MRCAALAAAVSLGAPGPATAQTLGELLATAAPAGELVTLANSCVVVRYIGLEFPPAAAREAATRPTVIYIRVDPGPGILNTVLLEPPPDVRPERSRRAAAMAVHIEVLRPPAATSALGSAGTELPRGAVKDAEWEGGSLTLATFAPLDFGVGAGRFPSVTTFLSEGVVDVSNRGVRRRMAVRAGDTFWFEAYTRLTVVSDDAIGAAIVHLYPDRRGGDLH